MIESLRAIFTGDLADNEAAELVGRWCAWAQRSRFAPFVKAARTIRTHRHGILASIRLGLSNARLTGLNQRVAFIVRHACSTFAESPILIPALS